MREEPCRHPDLLRRFVPTPYVFSKFNGPNRISIESNDLEIALGVRRTGLAHCRVDQERGLVCKLIRDIGGPANGSEKTIVSDGALRVLYRGTGTILIHDLERSELLGFIAKNVKVEELVTSLIPALVGGWGNNDSTPALLQTSDKRHIW
jgi:hypothetical protein